jgi:hypothetical protein
MLQTGLAGDKDAISYTYATIANTCGPVDNPELVLILTEQPRTCEEKTPSRFISLYLDGWSIPRTVNLPTKNGDGSYRYEKKSDNSIVNEPALSGTVTIDDSARKGHYDLKFRDGDVEKGDFRLRKCIRRIYCP